VVVRKQIGAKLLATEGEEWIRKAARTAAVPDTWRVPWTLRVSPRAWHLSVRSVRPVPAADGKILRPPRPRADRTACGACETYEPGRHAPAVMWRSGPHVPRPYVLRSALAVHAIPAALLRTLRRGAEAVSIRLRPAAFAR